MNIVELELLYRDYIECLNRQDWDHLPQYIHDDVEHNGRPLGVDGYRAMLESDYAQIPDLHFEIELLVVQPPHIACRLCFRVTPTRTFLDLPVNGRKVTFWENVFYRFQDGKIRDVRSVIDKPAIEAQLRSSRM